MATSRQTIKNRINATLRDSSKGIFKDESWKGVIDVWQALREKGFEPEVMGSEYQQDEKGNLISKTWKFQIIVEGYNKPFFGVLVAAGCGTVADPLAKYDIAVYVS